MAFWNRRRDTDLSDELDAHREALIREGARAGLDPGEAKRRARLSLGDSRVIAERIGDGDLITALEGCWRDVALGLRGLWRSPVFAAAAILTLGAGIGANTAIFTLLHNLLLRSLPVEEADRLVRVRTAGVPGNVTSSTTFVPNRLLEQLRRQQRSFTGVSAWNQGRIAMGPADSVPKLVQSGLVSGGAFETLGVTPRLGRLLRESDDVPGGPVGGWPAVLSDGLWRDAFESSPDVIGRRLMLSEVPVVIVGVVPPEFRGPWPGSETKVYLPMAFDRAVTGRPAATTPEQDSWSSAIARLKPGVSLEEAQAELATIDQALIREFFPSAMLNQPWSGGLRLQIESARTGLPSFFGRVYSRPLYLMQGLVAIVLLLCCINVSGLMMAKVHARRQEFAIRTGIGAARTRLMRQSLTESFVIAAAGAALGALIAWQGVALLLPFFRHPNEGTGLYVTPDRSVLFTSAALAMLTTLVFGAAPAWRAGGAAPGELLASRTSSGSRRQWLVRGFLFAQVALSFLLVSIATLLSSSLAALRSDQTGFALDQVTIQTAPMHLLKIPLEARLDVYYRMARRIEQEPGVSAAAFSWYTPMTSFEARSSFQAEGGGAEPRIDTNMAYNEVSAGYFRTMRTNILAGREFEDRERDRSVCVLNESAAAHLFPGESAVDRYVRMNDAARFPNATPCRVVGIARDAKFGHLHERPPRTIYFPVSLRTLPNAFNLVFLIHSPTKEQSIAAYRAAKAELAPSLPFVLFVTLREQMEAALGSQSALSLLSAVFAGLALFLSGLGLYGMLAASVAQRTPEIGVRMALGAAKGQVLWLVLSEALTLLVAGLAVGAALLIPAGRAGGSLLFGVDPFDPVRLALIAGVLAAVAALAAAVPALRAASVDPVRTLR